VWIFVFCCHLIVTRVRGWTEVRLGVFWMHALHAALGAFGEGARDDFAYSWRAVWGDARARDRGLQ